MTDEDFPILPFPDDDIIRLLNDDPEGLARMEQLIEALRAPNDATGAPTASAVDDQPENNFRPKGVIQNPIEYPQETPDPRTQIDMTPIDPIRLPLLELRTPLIYLKDQLRRSAHVPEGTTLFVYPDESRVEALLPDKFNTRYIVFTLDGNKWAVTKGAISHHGQRSFLSNLRQTLGQDCSQQLRLQQGRTWLLKQPDTR